MNLRDAFGDFSKHDALALPEFLLSQKAHWIEATGSDFDFLAHDHQRPPARANSGREWTTWLILGGRGAGKTRAGAEWVRGIALDDPKARIALIAETEDDAREVMIEGVSGLLAVHRHDERPKWTSSRGYLRWKNGAIAQVFTAENYERLRGPQFSAAWLDELAKWRQGGTEYAMGAALPAGAPFVLLDQHILTVASGLDALERALQLRIVAANRDHGDASALALGVTPQATALRPLAPVHLSARRDGSGVTFKWVRRARFDADSWAGEIPLGEDSEQYALDILSGTSVVRTLAATAPSVLYASASELADFGAPQTSLNVQVTQLSATVGRGFAASAILTP